MPAKSKAQQKASGLALAIQRGEAKPRAGTASAAMAKMPAKSLKEFASTKHKGLPTKAAKPSKLAKGMASKYSR